MSSWLTIERFRRIIIENVIAIHSLSFKQGSRYLKIGLGSCRYEVSALILHRLTAKIARILLIDQSTRLLYYKIVWIRRDSIGRSLETRFWRPLLSLHRLTSHHVETMKKRMAPFKNNLHLRNIFIAIFFILLKNKF